MNLIQELFTGGKLSEERKNELQLEVEKTETTEEEVILKNKIVDEQSLFALKSKLSGIPLIKPKAEEVPLEVLELISEEAAINYKMIPLFKEDNSVGIGMVYPENTLAQNALRFLSRKENFTYKIYLVTFSDLNNILKQHRTLKKETKKALTEFSKEKSEILNAFTNKDSASLNMSEDAPIIKMVLVILRHAIEGDASDIHIEPNKERLNIRFRQDGVLHLSLFLPLSVHPSIVSRIKILANLKIDENRIPQDGRFSAKINNKDIDFRVATFPTLYGEKVEIRVLDPTEGSKSFDALGLSGRNLELIQAAIKNPYGLILSSGPTGSGKTTTLYSFLRELNKEAVNIVTIEDPIEYSIDGINQSQVKPEIGYTFSEALRQVLRQDPNVIMVGEIRDEETANLVIQSALTGHIVLSTLHTNSAVGVIPRLIDMGIRPFLIPSTLKLAISQRLIRALCDRCKKKARLTEKAQNFISENIKYLPIARRKEIEGLGLLHVYEANGCEECNFKGYKGRIGLFEVLAMTDELASIILENPVESLILKTAQKQGMLTMAQEGILKVLGGQTSIDEITRVTQEKDY
ncbi:MAG: type II/IV secretion system protein [Candidatus Staskawiczbacteria bacterium]|nr:type II/IV secretion system protein [Candidatus Staskawiczbacteria bacterium]